MKKNNEKYLKRISEILDLMSVKLFQELNKNMFSEHSKNIIRILILREVLSKRIYELAKTAYNLYLDDTIIPAIILTRSVAETSASLNYLYESIKASLEKKSTSKLEKILLKMAIGAKNEKDIESPINIMEIIRKTDKTYIGFLSSFEELSEFCHPNWAGSIGSFSEIERNCSTIKLGMSDMVKDYPKSLGILSLLEAIEIFLSSYTNLKEITGKFILHSTKY